MVAVIDDPDALRKMFTALTEHCLHVDLGIADAPLVDYVAQLLVRFVRYDALYRVRDVNGRPLEDVAAMLAEAEERVAAPRRELYRHVGDVALFWTGVFPEAIARMQASGARDGLLDYQQQGKRSYFIASTFDVEPYREEAPVLRRLSEEFELLAVGLRRVRAEWENLSPN